MNRIKWTDRTFPQDLPEGLIFNILERLSGTGPRLIDICLNLSNQDALVKKDSQWSIKEHIGHLKDLEELHIGRLHDFKDKKESLRPADMTNQKTNQGTHNERSLELLIVDFIYHRNLLIGLYENLDDSIQVFSSLHPRLNIQMKPVDLAYFIAEHDDHHLASIREIMKSFAG